MPKPGKKMPQSKARTYSDFRGGGLNLAASDRFLKEN